MERNSWSHIIALTLVVLVGLSFANPTISEPLPQRRLTRDEIASIRASVLSLTNSYRRQNGVNVPLQANSLLDQAAQGHAQYMSSVGVLDHVGAGGSHSYDRVAATGYRFSTVGENIASCPATAQDVMTGWMNSAGHRANILNPIYTELGVGYVYCDYCPNKALCSNCPCKHWWVQNFATPAMGQQNATDTVPEGYSVSEAPVEEQVVQDPHTAPSRKVF